jgi:hypothetical protein
VNDQKIDRSHPRRLSEDSLQTPTLDRIHELTHHPHHLDYKYELDVISSMTRMN